MRSDDFLDRYKKLEEALNLKYGLDEKTFGSPVMKFINDREGKNYREKLDLCREIRNFLSHHADIGGEPVIEPSESIINFLDEVIQFVERPPLARGFCTLYENVLKTTPSQKAQTVMKKMQRMGFSHIPVVSEGEFIGVFSVSTVFSYALKYGIFGEFSVCMKNGLKSSASDVQALVQKLKDFITANFYTCTNDILAGLGQMYVCDERFKANIDKHAAGTAEFVSDSIKTFCQK